MNTATTNITANIAAIETKGMDEAEVAAHILQECCYSSKAEVEAVVEAMFAGKVTHENVPALENKHKVTLGLVPAINRLKGAGYTLSEHEQRRLSGLKFLYSWWTSAIEVAAVSKSTREAEEYALAHYEQYGELP